jgi:hypothetical protein
LGTYQVFILAVLDTTGQKQGATLTLRGIEDTAPLIAPGFSLNYSLRLNSVLSIKLPIEHYNEHQNLTITLSPLMDFIREGEDNILTVRPTEDS